MNIDEPHRMIWPVQPPPGDASAIQLKARMMSTETEFSVPPADRFGEPFEQDGFARTLAIARRQASGSAPGPGLFWLSGYMSRSWRHQGECGGRIRR
jgi:hypothetical protein